MSRCALFLRTIACDDRKIFYLEACSAYETAVNVRHTEEPLRCFCVDASAVLNANLFRRFASVKLADRIADDFADLLRLLRRCGSARSDCPDGLVCEDQRFDLLGAKILQRNLYLVTDVLRRNALVSLRSDSPTQIIGFRPYLKAACALRFTGFVWFLRNIRAAPSDR